MKRSLIIVESPAKARSMDKYLGPEFTALASYGHVRDLHSKKDAVDPDNDFRMNYGLLKRNQQHLQTIINAARHAATIYLATDPDREGEAISWHLYETLKDQGLLKNKTIYRVVFHEITAEAVLKAVANPRSINQEMVDAQQARRALDHLVGFHLSPLLWKKIRQGLSAGRVQSPALRMIVDREAEIKAFEAREYWTIVADCHKEGTKPASFEAQLRSLNDEVLKPFSITCEDRAIAAKTVLEAAAKERLCVSKLHRKRIRRQPAPPFTTSTLQQEAAQQLGFSAHRTMRAAQRLYEGLDGDGLITYMRTDSVNISQTAITQIRDLIRREYGADQVPETSRHYTGSTKNAQEAHEAIRPTLISRTPESLAHRLEYDHLNLYSLIWKRSVASQMSCAIIDTVSVDLSVADTGVFHTKGETLYHPGFLVLYKEAYDEQANIDKQLPPLKKGDWLNLSAIRTLQHFTCPPSRYTEASLINALEAYGIGRPSTYASIISVLLNREYATLESRQFLPTEIGGIVSQFMSDHFSRYVDYTFTAELEDQLDAIARGEKKWKPILQTFWLEFKQQLIKKEATVKRSDIIQVRKLGTDPQSNKPVSVRLGRYGAFAQIGTREDSDKPRFASLEQGQRVESITFEEAMALFILPRQLGETAEGEAITTAIGRFGPYIRYAQNYVPLLKDDSPYTISLEHALELIAQKKNMDAARTIKSFQKQNIQVRKGRYGPYITDGTTNARIPKKLIPEQLTLKQCQALIKEAANKRSHTVATKREMPAATKAKDSNNSKKTKPNKNH